MLKVKDSGRNLITAFVFWIGLGLLPTGMVSIVMAMSVGPALFDQGQIAFIARDNLIRQETIAEIDVSTGLRRNLLTDTELRNVSARWSPDCGQIAFASYRTGNWEIFAVDVLTGAEHNLSHNPSHDVLISWSPDSRKIAFTSNREGRLGHYMMNRDGGQIKLLTPLTVERALAWSPDGLQLALWGNYAGTGIYLMDANDPSQYTKLAGIEYYKGPPIWSKDGSRIIFTFWNFNRAQRPNSEIASVDVHQQMVHNLTSPDADDESPDVSPDGRQIVFLSRQIDEMRFQIHVMDIDGRNRRQLTHYDGYVADPHWSPDGSQIAFLASQGRRLKIMVMDADGSGLRQLSSAADDVWMLAWRPQCP